MRRKYRNILIVVVMIGMAACSDDDNPTGSLGTTPTNPKMSALVDGQTWTAVQIETDYRHGRVTITGSDADALLRLSISFVGDTAGTYTFGPTATAVGYGTITNNVLDNWVANTFQGSGTITVSTLTTTRATGTFSYTTGGSSVPTRAIREVTDGAFDVTF